MKTRTTKYIRLFKMAAAIVLLVTGGVACKKFLEVPPQGSVTNEEISRDPAAAQSLVDGVYNIMWLGGFGPDVHGFQYVILTNIASDDADKGSSPNDYSDAGQIDNFTVTPSNSNINNIWQGYYQAISRANQALDRLPLSPVDDATKNRLIAEVRFLRGYFYFNIVRFFGGVPLLDRVPSASEANDPKFQTRASADEVYNFIIADLQFAVDNLPVKEQTAVGRATKAAAQGMLAKVYLYRKDYQKVFALTDAIIKGQVGSYSLYPNYDEIWRERGANSSESIFEVQTGVTSGCNTAIQLYSVSQGPRAGGKGGWSDLGFGFDTPSPDLVNSYEPGDKRRAATIIFIDTVGTAGTRLWDGFRIPSKDSVENKFYNYKAYHSRTGAEKSCGNNDFLPKNLRILRLADVMLMHAEAAFQLGNAGAALSDINAIRARAGLAPLTTLSLDAIWHERRMELAMEHDRFFDLVRQESVQPGRIVPIFQRQGKVFTKGKNEVFPIPQPQIDLSGGVLTQNPGY